MKCVLSSEGTTAFTPPEAISRTDRNLRTFDGRARDLWSVGITLYVAACGKLPFTGPVPVRVQFSILLSPVDYDALPSTMDGYLRRLIEGLLEKDPVKRLNLEKCRAILAEAPLRGAL